MWTAYGRTVPATKPQVGANRPQDRGCPDFCLRRGVGSVYDIRGVGLARQHAGGGATGRSRRLDMLLFLLPSLASVPEALCLQASPALRLVGW